MADDWIIFVDTNIFLDFYRFPGESAKRQMQALERHKDKLIISEQVRMEFLKNRQKVLLEAFKNIKKPAKTNMPQILADSQPAKLMMKAEGEAIRRHKQVTQRIENLLSKPLNYDEVLKSFNRIVKVSSPYNLKRSDPVKFKIRNRARKRFNLGYPPRKSSDNSVGDAFNWEWIIECANNSATNQQILIVSRDGDFGASLGKNDYLNDWLKLEFRDRVSRLRKVELTTKLTDALKMLDETVSEEDVQIEQKLISADKLPSPTSGLRGRYPNEDVQAHDRIVKELLNSGNWDDIFG